MLNVKNLTDTLSRMQLPELYNYATVNKNDPYIVSLALSIANQKKQADIAKRGQAGMTPQPKVVDQALAQMMAPAPQQQMLPEDTGIGQLPAQNMQRMAEGGIVAFDDGGKVPGYAGGVFTGDAVPSGAIIIGNMYKDPVTGEMKYLPGAEPQRTGYEGMSFGDVANKLKETIKNAVKNPSQYVTPAELRKKEIEKSNEAAAKQNALTSQAYVPRRSDEQQFVSDVAKRNNMVDPTATTVNTPGAGPVVVPPSIASTSRNITAPAAPKPVVSATPVDLMTGIKQLDTKTMSPEEAAAASSKFGTGSELTAGINQLRADTIASNKELSKAYEEGIAKLPKPGEEAEARLKQREAEDAVGKADAKAMAIFKAGLSMMAGTSQNAFENIGKGAMAGLEDYSASIKDFRKLATERDKAYAEIEAARNAAARDDFKTSMNLQERATDRLSRVNEKGIDVTATLFKTNKEAAATIWNTSNTLASANARAMNEAQLQANRSVFEQAEQTKREIYGQGEQTKRTAMQLAAPPAEARMAMMLGTGKTESERLESGLRKVQDLQSDKTGKVYAELYAKHVEDSRKNLTEPMTPTEFASSMRAVLASMAPKVTDKPGANAPVYNRP